MRFHHYYIIMDRQYQSLYRSKSLNHLELRHKILGQYVNYDPLKAYTCDELNFIFDEHIGEKCDRDVSKEIFAQSASITNETTLQDIVSKYIQNVETSKVCILRDQFRLKQLQNEYGGYKNRAKTFVFLNIIQASIFTRFTKAPTFHYRIMPTQLPPVTLINSLNPILNHQFTLQMEEQAFDISFFESGIEIFNWTFPDSHFIKEGQYHRLIKTQNVTFEAKIKYMPQEVNQDRQKCAAKIKALQDKLLQEKSALSRLCHFKPFLEQKDSEPRDAKSEKGGWFTATELIFSIFPCLRQHIKALYFILVLGILLQSWASSFWPIEFLDIIACFYGISLIYDSTIKDYSIRLLILQLTFLLLIIKSVWGAVEQPFFAKSQISRTIIVFCAIIKVMIILFLSITLIRKDQIPKLREQIVPLSQNQFL